MMKDFNKHAAEVIDFRTDYRFLARKAIWYDKSHSLRVIPELVAPSAPSLEVKFIRTSERDAALASSLERDPALASSLECDAALASNRSLNGSIVECLDPKSFPFPFLVASARYVGEAGGASSVQFAHRPYVWPHGAGAYRVYVLCGSEGSQSITTVGTDVRCHYSDVALNSTVAIKSNNNGASRGPSSYPLDLTLGLLYGESVSPHTAGGNMVLGAEVYRASDKQSMQGTFGLRIKPFSGSHTHAVSQRQTNSTEKGRQGGRLTTSLAIGGRADPPAELGVSLNTLGHVVASSSFPFPLSSVAAVQLEGNLTGSDTAFAFGLRKRLLSPGQLCIEDASLVVRFAYRSKGDTALSLEGGLGNLNCRLSLTCPSPGESWAKSRFGIGVEYTG